VDCEEGLTFPRYWRTQFVAEAAILKRVTAR
jgi:hypothetical protein